MCQGSVVIEAGYLSVLGHRDYGGLFETCWYYRLSQRQVENISEYTCHLLSACSEYTSRKSVGLVNVDLFKGLTSATESVITQSSVTADPVMHTSVLLASKRALK